MPKRIVAVVSDAIYAKMRTAKARDNFGSRSWGDWLTFKNRDVEASGKIEETSKKILLPLWCSNFARNLPHILKGETLSSLVPENPDQAPKGPCIVVGAGPSIEMHRHLDLLQRAVENGRYRGQIVACDRMLKPLLERNIIPALTGSVDGSPIISKWYNGSLVKKYGPKIKTCLISSVSPTVARTCLRNKLHIFWFTGLHDEMTQSDSFSRLQFLMTASPQHPNGLVTTSCGGNVGFTMYTLAHSLLRRSPIALIGFDMGYPEGTPLESTPYFSGYMDHAQHFGPDRSDIACQQFQKIYNPFFKKYAYIDEVFKIYRANFLSSLHKLPPYMRLFNCSEEGTLFSPGIGSMPFADFLRSVE